MSGVFFEFEIMNCASASLVSQILARMCSAVCSLPSFGFIARVVVNFVYKVYNLKMLVLFR